MKDDNSAIEGRRLPEASERQPRSVEAAKSCREAHAGSHARPRKRQGEAHAPLAFSLLLHRLFSPGVSASSVHEHLHSHNYIAL